MKKVKVIPYDETSEEKYELAKKRIIDILGDTEVVHRGSSSLKISGQDEIDIYIPVHKNDLQKYRRLLVTAFGNPRNADNSERIRFAMTAEGKKIDLFLIDKECEDWKSGVAFEKYLTENPASLYEYKLLKESMNNHPVEEYYKKKDHFTERILNIVKECDEK